MDVVWENLSTLANLMRNKMDSCATPNAEMATMVSVQSAGRIALLTSVMMGHTVVNQVLMDVAQDQFTNVTTVKSGVLYGIPNVVKDITTLVAVFALPIASGE